MAGGPLLQLWENLLPFAKDLRIRFAIAMLGNVLAILFIFLYPVALILIGLILLFVMTSKLK